MDFRICPLFIEAEAEIFRLHLLSSKYLSTFLFKKPDGLCLLLLKNWNSSKFSELRVAKRKPEKVLVDVKEAQKLLKQFTRDNPGSSFLLPILRSLCSVKNR